MADAGFPGQHSTTTTVKTSSTTVETSIRFDKSYIRTVTNLIGFICIECSGVFSYHTRGSYFNFVSMTAFWVTGILLLLYLFHVIEKLYKIPWLKIEFVFDAIWVILYLIAASLAVSFGPEAYIAAGES
ncbi:unnamed protein product [Callosobruchus maculatus]|uniref:MARVEL domain-containing protein n=1 Tax=Callosobruchus maculatus TaxID=64391 RepID=A0A653BLU4_CALMS|nr:unnamed protein product [Callosobruchus maculatus]